MASPLPRGPLAMDYDLGYPRRGATGDAKLPKIAPSIARVVAGLWLCLGATAVAQPVELDGSSNSTVIDTTSGLPSDCSANCWIEGQDRAGGSLFHSFSQFNVRPGVTVTFDGNSLEHILTRVTGGQPTQIDGILQVQGQADLFLLNPAGLVIGPTGQLDLSGTFLGSTAQILQFEDGHSFVTTEVGALPLLSLSVPSGLQLGSLSPGSITLQGNSSRPPLWQPNNPGQTLALISASDAPLAWSDRSHGVSAGGLVLANGSAGNQQVALEKTAQGWDFDVSAGQWDGPIELDNLSLTNLGDQPGGSISIDGDLTLTNSEITLESDGLLPAGNFVWQGDRLVVAKTELQTSTSAGGGNIDLLSDNTITIRDDSLISVASMGPGPVGNITLEALGLLGGLSLQQSQISSSVETEGGNISLLSPFRILFDQGELFAATEFDGANVSLETNGVLTLNDSDFISVSSGDGITAGPGGNLSIKALFVNSFGRDTDIKVVGPPGNFDFDIWSFIPFIGFGSPTFTTVIRGNRNSEIQVTELPTMSSSGPSFSPSPPVTNPPSAVALPPSTPLTMASHPSSQPIPVSLPSLTVNEPEEEPPMAQQPPPSQPSPGTQPSQSPESEVAPVSQQDSPNKVPGSIGDRPPTASEFNRPSCTDHGGYSRLRISGRGGIAAPPGSPASGSPSLADLGPDPQTAPAMAMPQRGIAPPEVYPPTVTAARPWIEAQGWERTPQGKIQLLSGPGILPPAQSRPCQPLS